MKKKKKTWALQPAIYSALRRNFRTYPAYSETLKEAKREYFIKSKKGKPLRRVKFLCCECLKEVSQKEIRVDHVDPVVPIEGIPLQNNGLPDFNTYIDRLYCNKSNLQCICKSCHDLKSKQENKARKESKKEKAPATLKKTKKPSTLSKSTKGK